MIKHYCDRCGAQLKPRRTWKEWVFRWKAVNEWSLEIYTDKKTNIMLCLFCRKDFYDWFKEK